MTSIQIPIRPFWIELDYAQITANQAGFVADAPIVGLSVTADFVADNDYSVRVFGETGGFNPAVESSTRTGVFNTTTATVLQERYSDVSAGLVGHGGTTESHYVPSVDATEQIDAYFGLQVGGPTVVWAAQTFARSFIQILSLGQVFNRTIVP